jgi:hypothetical protein
MKYKHTALALFLTVTTLVMLLAGCSKKPPMPPHVYTTAATGASDITNLADRFKQAYAAHDADAAMQLFYWQPADTAGLECQRFWWGLLTKIFATPADSIEILPPRSDAKTGLPVVNVLLVKTNKTNYDLLIGKDEKGFYITPPLWPETK